MTTNNTNEPKAIAPTTEQEAPSSANKPGENVASCPPAPEPRKRKTVSVLQSVSSLPAPASIVTPVLPAKRRRLDVVSPSPIPAASSSSTPSYQALYGDDEDRFQSLMMPNLNETRPGNYKRRNSVTKFSLQAAHHMTLLEAAKKTLEKLRQESLQNEGPEERQRRRVMRSLFDRPR